MRACNQGIKLTTNTSKGFKFPRYNTHSHVQNGKQSHMQHNNLKKATSFFPQDRETHPHRSKPNQNSNPRRKPKTHIKEP